MSSNKKLHRCDSIEVQPCNSDNQTATTHATIAQPTSLKALVEQRFTSNQSCNPYATHAKTTCNFSKQLDNRIRIMAEKWSYTDEELNFALTQSINKPNGWDRLCTADEKLTNSIVGVNR